MLLSEQQKSAEVLGILSWTPTESFALAEPGGQEALPPCALPQGKTPSSGTRGSAGTGSATSHQLKPDRACFCLAEVPAAFRNPSDEVQAKRKKSRSYLSI